MAKGRPAASPPAAPRVRGASASGPKESVLSWLLEESEPSIRYLALTQLLHRAESSSEVSETREQIGVRGWAAAVLDGQLPGGAWPPEASFYRPKYTATNWQLLVLSDLGLNRTDPRVARACELWMDRYAKPDGGFNTEGARTGHHCLTGNTVRALLRFGYLDEPRVLAGLDWLVRTQAKLGGWSCFGSGRNLDSWEGMSAFAAYPRARWSPEIEEAVRRGAEFFMSRELYRQGAEYPPWERFHYPVHYYYDLLVGLDFLTELGFAGDPRLGYALDVLRSRRRADGRWNLDGVHPHVEGATAEWFDQHPTQRPIPLALETVGRPSKMITLTALRVLQRVDDASSGPGTTTGGR